MFGFISMILAGAGAGMKFASSRRQADTLDRVSAYNYAIDRQNAESQAYFARHEIALQQAQMQALARSQEQNAKVLELEASRALETGRDNVKRRSHEWRRLKSRQENKIGKSGVISAGTPVDILAETAGLEQLNLSDTWYGATARNATLRTRANELYAARNQTLLNLDFQSSRLRSVKVGLNNAYKAAEFRRDSALSNSQGMRSAAAGNLIGDISGAAAGGHKLFGSGALFKNYPSLSRGI